MSLDADGVYLRNETHTLEGGGCCPSPTFRCFSAQLTAPQSTEQLVAKLDLIAAFVIENGEDVSYEFATCSFFIDALVNLAGRKDEAGHLAVAIMATICCGYNDMLLYKTPGFLNALLNTPHTAEALDALSTLCNMNYGTMSMELATNGELVELLVANVGTSQFASGALANLCDRSNPICELMFDYPGLIDAVTSAMYATPDCATSACRLLENISRTDELGKSIARNSKIIDALIHVLKTTPRNGMAKSRAVSIFVALSKEVENSELLSDHAGLVPELAVARVSSKALARICAIPSLHDDEDDSLKRVVFSRPFRHHSVLAKAVIRTMPMKSSKLPVDGLAALTLARKANLGELSILLRRCMQAACVGDTLQHIVGYTRSQAKTATAQRTAAILCLKQRSKQKLDGADEPGADVDGTDVDGTDEDGADEPGAINVENAVHSYVTGGRDAWSVILQYAY